MDWSSWIRKALLKDNSKATTADPSKANDPPPPSKKQPGLQQPDLEEYGITDKLVDSIRTFTVDTFKSFPLQVLQMMVMNPGGTLRVGQLQRGNAKRDLSEWQERHTTIVLARGKQLAQLRCVLCPRQMKELRFRNIYFVLVRSHVAEYELRARPNEMKNGGGKTLEGNGFEVETSESKPSTAQEPTL